MPIFTKPDFSRQLRQRPDTIAQFSGITYLDQGLFVKGIEIDTDTTTASNGYALTYNGTKIILAEVSGSTSGGGTITGATNGLSISSSGRDTKLGGSTLVESTIISGGSQDLKIGDINSYLNNFDIYTTGFTVNYEDNKIQIDFNEKGYFLVNDDLLFKSTLSGITVQANKDLLLSGGTNVIVDISGDRGVEYQVLGSNTNGGLKYAGAHTFISANTLTFNQIQTIDEARILGRSLGSGNGNIEELTKTQVRQIIDYEIENNSRIINSGGDTTIQISNGYRERIEYISVESGSGDRNLILESTNANENDIIRLLLNFDSVQTPNIRVKNLTSSGTQLFYHNNFSGNTSEEILVECVYDGSNWNLTQQSFAKIDTEHVLGTFLDNQVTTLKQTEVNDGGHSTTRNDVNGLLHWTVGTRYRSWDTVNISASTTGGTIFSTTDYFSGSAAAPSDGTNFFFPAGSLKEGMNIKIKYFVSVGVTDDVDFDLVFDGSNVDSITLPANNAYEVEVNLIVTNVDNTSGSFKCFTKAIRDGGNPVYSSITTPGTFDTVNDATIDIQATTGALTGCDILSSEIIIAG